MRIIFSFLLVFPFVVLGQSPDKNYIRTTVYNSESSGTYSDMSKTFNMSGADAQSFFSNYGQGTIKVSIINDVLTVTFNVSFPGGAYMVAQSPTPSINISAPIPYQVLGNMDCGPSYPNLYKVSIGGNCNCLKIEENYSAPGATATSFIKTFTVSIADPDNPSYTADQKLEQITYFDGLGRPVQDILLKNSATKKNIVSHYEYDSYGRTEREFLPFSSNQNGQDFVAGASTLQSGYYTQHYGDNKPYQVSVFEPSPLNRKLKQGGTGTLWQPNPDPGVLTDRVSRYEYRLNTLEENVMSYKASSQWNPTRKLYVSVLEGGTPPYQSNRLQKIVSKNENWKALDGKLNTIEEFINMEGKLILKRSFSFVDSILTPHDTYYVYDQYGNLSYVIPPLADTPSTQLDDLCYQYLYDYRGRIAEKKLPGKGWEYIVYDKMDRPVLVQDSRLKLQGKWLFSKYDAFGRITYTGEYNDTAIRDSIQTSLDLVVAPVLYEAKSSTPILIGGTNTYYTNSAFPVSNTNLFTINYYDSYANSDLVAGATIPSTTYYGASITADMKTLPAVVKVRTLGTSQWATSVTGYDDKARVIWSRTDNPTLGTIDIIENKLDFLGKVLERRTTHTKTGAISNLITYDFYEYDHADRLVRHNQKIGPNATQLIAFNSYDELGMLVEKKVGTRWNRFDVVGVSYSNGTYKKTATTESWTNAKISSLEKIIGSGNLSFLVTNASDEIRIGISTSASPSSVPYNQIEYAVGLLKTSHSQGGKELKIFKGTTDLGIKTNYKEGDEIIIERIDKNINFKKNGVQFYTLSGASSSATYFPTAYFFYPNATMKDISINNYTYRDAYALEKTRYNFNIKGWLTGINKPTSTIPSPNELFSLELHYNNPTAGATALYNGNISQTSWRTMTGNQWKNYSYTYDGLDRLNKALYKNTGNAGEDSNFFENVSYDRNGNIENMKRSGNGSLQMDVMTYYYDGNRLMRIREDGIAGEGFTTVMAPTNTAEQYSYDINGNMTRDLNKGIVNGSTDAITYNHLNLPTEIIFNGDASTKISYTYNALGQKLRKVVTTGTNTATTEYGPGYGYSKVNTGGTKLDFIAHPEGYCTLNSNAVATLSYIYQYKDHLGNVRLSYSDSNRNGSITASEVIEENHYFPFGLKHSGGVYNGGGNANAQKYKYNGKELQEELGLNVTAMDFRQYDNATGRFTTMDVLSEMYYNISPYGFARNNPVALNDPTGLCDECDDYYAGQTITEGQSYVTSFGSEYTYSNGEWTWQGGTLNEVAVSNDKSMFGNYDDRSGIDRFDNDFDWYAYTDNLGQMTNATTTFWGTVQTGVNKARQYNLAKKVAPAFGIGTQAAASRLKAFTNSLGVWGNRIGIAGYGLSVVSIGTKVITGEQISTADTVGFGINTALVAAAWIVAGTTAAPAVAIIALVYGAAELASYAYNQKTLEQNILE